MLLRTGHTAERVGQPRRDGEDREHLQQIRERRRVLVWVRAVGVEEAPAVRTPFLDEFLRGDRPLGDLLLGYGLSRRLAVGVRLLHFLWVNDFGDRVRLQVLRYASGDQQQRAYQAEGQQNPERGARHIHPEVAERVPLAPRDP